MQCPVCETSELQPVQRQGIKIDLCPQCHGVWLDRGELDHLLQAAQAARKSKRDYDQFYDAKHKPQQENNQFESRAKKRRQELDLEDFLEEIFDIFD